MIPVFKKKDRNNVENYRPVSILPNLSKIYERCLYDQMYKYFNHIFSKWQCGFRKGFSTQHRLLVMTEKWRKSFENLVTSLCKKASQKLRALARISHYMDLNKCRNLMKSFITSQFSHSPLICMFHSRNLNNTINQIHERALR